MVNFKTVVKAQENFLPEGKPEVISSNTNPFEESCAKTTHENSGSSKLLRRKNRSKKFLYKRPSEPPNADVRVDEADLKPKE